MCHTVDLGTLSTLTWAHLVTPQQVSHWWVVDGERDVGQFDEWSSVEHAHSMAQHGVRLVRQCTPVKVALQMC